MWIKKSKNLHLLLSDTHGHSTRGERLLVGALCAALTVPCRVILTLILNRAAMPASPPLSYTRPSLLPPRVEPSRLAPSSIPANSDRRSPIPHTSASPTTSSTSTTQHRVQPSFSLAESAPSTVGHHWSSTEASNHPSSPSLRSSSARFKP